MCLSPSARRTYSTKSVESARRVSPVRWSSTLSPDEPGTKWTRSPPRSACGFPARSYRVNAFGASAMARSTTSRGNRTRSPFASSGRPCSRSRRRISGPRISIPTSASTRFASSRIRPMRASSRTVSRGRIAPSELRRSRAGVAVVSLPHAADGEPGSPDRRTGTGSRAALDVSGAPSHRIARSCVPLGSSPRDMGPASPLRRPPTVPTKTPASRHTCAGRSQPPALPLVR